MIRPPDAESTAHRAGSLVGTPAIREVVPYDPQYSTRWHRHDYPDPVARWNFHQEYEIHLITQGTGSYIVGDTIGRFGPGQLMLVGPEMPHDWIGDLEPGEVITGRDVVLHFHDEWITDCIRTLPELTDLQSLRANARRGIEFLGETAAQGAEALLAIGASSGTERLTATFSLLGILANGPEHERRYLATEWVPTVQDPDPAELMNEALDYILDNLDTEVRLATVATRMNMSESALSRFFKRASGQTFSETVRRLRLARACKLLQETDSLVASIAHAAGYQNLSNFNRQFLTEYGCTPQQFRKRARGC